MSRTIVVTGASGQLGTALAQHVRDTRRLPDRFVFLDRSSLDVTDEEAVQRCFSDVLPDIVINAAAYTAVDRAENETEAAYAVNARGPRILAVAADQCGAKLIHLSTDFVFDGTKLGGYTEEDTPAPLSVYGNTKLSGELAVLGFDRNLVIRTSWVYGESGSNFVKTIRKLLSEDAKLRVVDDQVGCPTAACDLAEAILAVEPMASGLLHLASPTSVSWHGFARAIASESGYDPTSIEPIPGRDYPTAARRPRNSILDCSRAHRVHSIVLPAWQESVQRVCTSLELSSL